MMKLMEYAVRRRHSQDMRCASLLVVAAATCSDAAEQTPPPHIPMQIVVSSSAVQVYMQAADLGDCGCSAVAFPTVGACSFLTDANPCNTSPFCQSCFTDVGVELNGELLTPTAYGGHDPWTRYYGEFRSGELSLVLNGCGQPTTRVSLDGAPLLQPTATADYVGGAPHVMWTIGAPVLSTMLTLYGGTHGELCHVQDVAEYTFTNWTFASSVGVQTFGSRADVETAFGPATIWRAGDAFATFPTLP